MEFTIAGIDVVLVHLDNEKKTFQSAHSKVVFAILTSSAKINSFSLWANLMTSSMFSLVNTWPRIHKDELEFLACLRVISITSRIARINDDNSFHIAMLASFFDGSFQFIDVKAPLVVFVQVIPNLLHVVLDNRS